MVGWAARPRTPRRVPPDPDVYCGSPATQLCIKCGGEFVIGLAQPGAVHVDFVYLQPGAWGRFAGLPVRKDGAEMLKTLGSPTGRITGCCS